MIDRAFSRASLIVRDFTHPVYVFVPRFSPGEKEAAVTFNQSFFGHPECLVWRSGGVKSEDLFAGREGHLGRERVDNVRGL